ncbi:MAG: helicase-related protein, partial [Thiobacillus sp.]
YLSLTSMVMFGGVNINPQLKALKSRVDILVATPGRLLDHMGQKTVDLSGIEILVLDEADRMLDMGFIRDIKKVLAVVPKQRQTLLFSATFSDEIRTLANGLLNNPKSVEVARRNTTVEVIEQSMHRVPQAHKRDLLAHLIKHHDWQQVLVFTRTKHGANKLAEKLIKDGIAAAAIHGNKSQSARTKALASFKDGGVRVLVATDIAARGIDIDQLPQVVNFELPNVPEDYVHRIGRTGRAGTTGSALSLVDDEELSYLRDIEKLIKRSIVRVEVEPGFVPPAKADLMSEERPPRPPQGRGSGSGSGRSSQAKPASAGAKPAGGRSGAPGQSTQARKPRPPAALFAGKPGSRGH